MSRNLASSSLQDKLSATLLAVMVGFGVLSFVILRAVITPAFDDLETDSAATDLARAERVIRADLDKLVSTTGDWAPWDDAWAYVRGENPNFIASNLDIPTIVNLDLNLLAFFDASGRNHWRQFVVDGAAAEFVTLGAFSEDHPVTRELIAHTETDSVIAGLLSTAYGPMLICSMPIIRSNETGPIAGTLVMARFLDEAHVERMSEQAAVPFRVLPLDDADGELVARLAAADSPGNVAETLDTEVLSYSLIRDVFDEPFLLLETRTPRNVTALGKRTVDMTLLFLAGAGIVVAIAAWVLLRRFIVLPLEALARHIVRIRRSGDLAQKLDSDRPDEIGALAGEFDKLTSEVARARALLLDQSFKAGKADTAAEVLHNIRNAMTPLVNGLERLRKCLGASDRLRVHDATAALGDPDCPEERRQKFLEYLNASFEHLRATAADAEQELDIAIRQARQVEGILADQEKHSKSKPVYETLRLDEVAEEAVHVIPKGDAAVNVDVRLAPDLAGYSVHAHRVGLQQILGNLVLNAYESIQRSQSGSGTIELEAKRDADGDKAMVRLVVRDTGCGFDALTRDRIFQRGFTSKQGSLTGLGLHWCANAVAGMGGRIHAESAGPGHGAEFCLLLPDGGKTSERAA